MYISRFFPRSEPQYNNLILLIKTSSGEGVIRRKFVFAIFFLFSIDLYTKCYQQQIVVILIPIADCTQILQTQLLRNSINAS